ncbi:MAG: hypothetical protein RL637_1802 [Pseudomonadota bacterium]|jgi:lipoprotein NlpD
MDWRERYRLFLLLLLIQGCEDQAITPVSTIKVAAVSQPSVFYHQVKSGDTLYRIGLKYGYDYQQIAEWNQLKPPFILAIGQRLVLFTQVKKSLQSSHSSTQSNRSTVPPPASPAFIDYLVQTNDTLYKLSRRFGVSVKSLMLWNQLSQPQQLHAGQSLKIAMQTQQNPKIASSISAFLDNKTLSISNNNQNMLKFYTHWPSQGKIVRNFAQTSYKGIEISGNLGQNIRAIASGKVVAVTDAIYGHGQFVVVQHPDEYLSSYAYTQKVSVSVGQRVKAGQVIAQMGRLGQQPPSVEIEIRHQGRIINPLTFLSNQSVIKSELGRK